MLAFRQFCGLLLWINLLTFNQYVEGCTLNDFRQSSLFDENFDLSNLKQNYDGGERVRVPCKVGFRGFFKIICASDGQWHSTSEKCRAISCGHPGDVQFADFRLVKGTDYDFGSQVLYTCHRGYQMTSYTNTRNCLQGGWDGHLPECEPVSCPSLPVDRNVLINGDMDQPQSGSVIQFTCSSRDDELVGPVQIVCDENGNWDNKPPTCKEISCAKPPLENFKVEGAKLAYKKNEFLRYTCNSGYIKVDGRAPQCGKVGQSSQWTPMPQCELITCKLSADPPEGTTYSPLNQIIFRPGQTVTVSCEGNRWVKSKELLSAELTCQPDGQWDYESVCQMVTCSRHAENVYDWERNWYGPNTVYMDQTLWYRCHQDYVPTSLTGRAKCTRRGWEPNPLCKERGCTKPSHRNAVIRPDRPQYDEYQHGDRVDFMCTYEPTVTFYVDCHYGNWRGLRRTCIERPCRDQPQVENGEMVDLKKEVYYHGESVRFMCEGETATFGVTCELGRWKKEKSCKAVACTRPNIPNGDIDGRAKSRYDHGETVRIRCTTGLRPTVTVSCQSEEWIPDNPCPEISKCGGADIPNGFSHEHENKLYYSCNVGFKLLTKGWWGEASCVGGVWKTSECVASTDCGPVPDIPHLIVKSEIQKFSHGDTFPIQCETGHQNLHTDLTELTCTKGKWTSKDVPFKQICTPIANKCNPPPKILNAVIMAPFEKEYSSGTNLTYRCRENYIMEGDGIVRCNNGTWNGMNISCQRRNTESTVMPKVIG